MAQISLSSKKRETAMNKLYHGLDVSFIFDHRLPLDAVLDRLPDHETLKDWVLERSWLEKLFPDPERAHIEGELLRLDSLRAERDKQRAALEARKVKPKSKIKFVGGDFEDFIYSNWWQTSNVSEILGITVRRVEQLCYAGKLKAVMVGKSIRGRGSKLILIEPASVEAERVRREKRKAEVAENYKARSEASRRYVLVRRAKAIAHRLAKKTGRYEYERILQNIYYND